MLKGSAPTAVAAAAGRRRTAGSGWLLCRCKLGQSAKLALAEPRGDVNAMAVPMLSPIRYPACCRTVASPSSKVERGRDAVLGLEAVVH
jgi:hypothetical protein